MIRGLVNACRDEVMVDERLPQTPLRAAWIGEASRGENQQMWTIMNMENKVHFEAEIYSQIFDLDK